MTKPLRHILIPPVVFDLLWSAGWTAIMYGSTGEKDTAITGAGFFLLLGLPVSLWLTEQLYGMLDEETARIKFEKKQKWYIQEKKADEPVVIHSIIDKPGQQQGDFFHGLTAQEWYDVAVKVNATGTFTAQLVGVTRRPKLIPMMLAAGYIKATGQSRYELTGIGRAFWRSLAELPPHSSDISRKRIENLGISHIYT